MTEVSLRDFLESGQLGPVRVGQGEDQLRAELGEPDDATEIGPDTHILKYGSLELHVVDRAVTLIGLYFRELGDLPASLRISGYVPRHATGIEEFMRFLDQVEVRYETDPRLTFGDQVCLRVGAGVLAVFDAHGNEMDSLQYTVEGP